MDRAAFLSKYARNITRDPLYGCWLFDRVDRDGYGTIWNKDGPRRAHLVAYRELVGEIPAGKVLDHECRRRACCRPEHLAPVAGSENDLRRSWRYRVRKTTCRNGHSLATCITSPEGGRLCRRPDCQGPEDADAVR